MRIRRQESSARLQPPPIKLDANLSSGNPSASPSSTRDSLGFDLGNPLTGLVSAETASGGRFGLPGLTHPKIELSEQTALALEQMAKEDPALYGRVIQHLNALDRSRTWTLRLDAKDLGRIDASQDRSFRGQLDANLGPKGLGTDPERATYWKGLIQYESTERAEVVKEPKPGNADAVQKMLDDVERWNAELASAFEFEHDVGDQLKNPEVSAAAIDELVALLEKHAEVLEGAYVELQGHTSTVGSDAYNLALSNQRAATVLALLEEKLAGTPLAGRVGFGSSGRGEAHPVDANGERLALGVDGRPLEPSQEDPTRSRRVELKVSPDPLQVEAQPGQIVNVTEAVGVMLEIKARPATSGGHDRRRPDSNAHVTKSRVSQQVGGEIPCPRWMKKLLGG